VTTPSSHIQGVTDEKGIAHDSGLCKHMAV